MVSVAPSRSGTCLAGPRTSTQSATKSTIARQVSASRGPKTGANYFDKWPRNCPPLSTATNKDDCWDWDAAGSEDLAAAVAL